MRLPALAVLLAAAAGCVPRAAAPPPQTAPAPQPAPPAPPTAPAPPPPPLAWQDAPLAAGDWRFAGGEAAAEAAFGAPGPGLFALRCEPGRRIAILRPGAAGPVAIVTSFGERVVPGSGGEGAAASALPASDPLFDQIAFSRGRFLVRAPGAADLVLPSWPEPARLIEECRGQ